MRKQTISLALALSLAFPLALAQGAQGGGADNDARATGGAMGGTGSNMGSVDQNQDNRVTQDELLVVLVDDFEQADANRDRQLDQNEFNTLGTGQDFDAWDTNNDDYIDDNEFYTGTFDTYDENENAHWEEGEWDDAGSAGWFDV
jgi:hypothetical protein